MSGTRDEPTPDQSSGWLGRLDGMTPEEWAAQFAAEPVVARSRVEPAGDSWFAAQVHGTAPEPTPGGFLVPPALAEEVMQQLREGFTALDAWYDSQVTPAGPVPWHRRLRRAFHRKVGALRDRAARRAYKVIAGDWPDDGTDW